jgi:pumilio family protein 6
MEESQKYFVKKQKLEDKKVLVKSCNQLWEKIRDKRTPREKRHECMRDLMELITGKIADLTFKHDTSRVIQTAYKKGSAEQRRVILSELEDKVLELAKNNYGRFLVPTYLSARSSNF